MIVQLDYLDKLMFPGRLPPDLVQTGVVIMGAIRSISHITWEQYRQTGLVSRTLTNKLSY